MTQDTQIQLNPKIARAIRAIDQVNQAARVTHAAAKIPLVERAARALTQLLAFPSEKARIMEIKSDV